MKINRRDLMIQMAQASAAGVFSQLVPQMSWAQTANQEREFFLTIYVPFGWDTSLCLDPWTLSEKPKESDFFVEYRQDQLVPFHHGFLGPSMGSLKNHFPFMTVVNGIFISSRDNGHDSAAHYMLSGNGQNSLGVLSLELEGNKFHSPFGTSANTVAKSGGKAKVILDLNPVLKNKSIGAADSLFILDEAGSELVKNKQAILQYSNQMKTFNQLISSFVGTGEAKNHHAVAASFVSGLSSTAHLQNTGIFLDTHSDHEKNHLDRLTQFFDSLNETLTFFSQVEMPTAPGVSLLDRTTIMVTSDFTRTPALNTSKGKDHNPQTNSVLLINQKLKPGIFGKSQLISRELSPSKIPYLASVPLHLQTMEPIASKEGTFILRPESLMRTLLEAMACDPATIRPSFMKAPLLTSMLR